MTKTRRNFTAEQKAAIVRRHLKGKESISSIAEALSIQPTQIHQWVAMAVVRWELRETMKELDVELVIAKATENILGSHLGLLVIITPNSSPRTSRNSFASTA